MKRFFATLVGVAFIAMASYSVLMGEFSGRHSSRPVTRADHPVLFWGMYGFFSLMGIVIIISTLAAKPRIDDA
jgi:hypothetical protein